MIAYVGNCALAGVKGPPLRCGSSRDGLRPPVTPARWP